MGISEEASGLRRAVPIGIPDWFRISWIDVWNRLSIAPHLIPGVRLLKSGCAEVHRSHLALLGYEVPKSNVIHKGPFGILRPYQIEGVKFIRERKGTLLASEQRTGKSPICIYSHDPKDGYCVVIGPISSRLAWHEWAARRFGACTLDECALCRKFAEPTAMRPGFHAIEHVKYVPEVIEDLNPQVLFMSFAVARGWSDLFNRIPIGTLVVDECHMSGNQNRRSFTIHSVRKLATVAKRIILSSGTPLTNKPKGLWPILDVAAPGAFGKFFPYSIRYCDAQPGPHGWITKGSSNEQELRKRLEEIMTRKRWVDIQDSLPPITRMIHICELDELTRNLISEEQAKIRYGLTFAHRTQVGDLARLRRFFAQAKIAPALDILTGTLFDGHSVIAWTWHRDVAYEIAAELRKSAFHVVGPVEGQMPTSDREALIRHAFDVAAHHPIAFVATMASCATGVDLSFAQHQVFVELDYTPAVIAQAEMRPFRGTEPITSTYMVADCKSDEDMAKALIEKLEMTSKLGLDGGVGDARELLAKGLNTEDKDSLDDLTARLVEAIALED